MKKFYYEIPTVEVVDVKVERGFNVSAGGYQPKGEEQEMDVDETGEDFWSDR